MALPEGSQRFWKTPVLEACPSALGPMLRMPGDAGGLVVAQHVVDGDAGKVVRSEDVDRAGAGGAAGNASGTEGLLVVGPVLLADEADGLGGAEVRLHEVGVGDGEDLRAGVEVLGETRERWR